MPPPSRSRSGPRRATRSSTRSGSCASTSEGHVKDHKLGKQTDRQGRRHRPGPRAGDARRAGGRTRRGRCRGGRAPKGLGLTDDNREQLEKDLKDGKAAVGVLVELHEADVLYKELTELGGTVKLLPTSEDALERGGHGLPVAEPSESVAAPARGG